MPIKVLTYTIIYMTPSKSFNFTPVQFDIYFPEPSNIISRDIRRRIQSENIKIIQINNSFLLKKLNIY